MMHAYFLRVGLSVSWSNCSWGSNHPSAQYWCRTKDACCDRTQSVKDFCVSSRKNVSGPFSSVGIATGYGLDGPGIESRWGRDFPHLSRPALWPNQTPVRWVPGLFRGKERPGRDADPSPLLVPWSRKSRAINLLSPHGPYGLYRVSVPVQGCALSFSTNNVRT